MEIFSALLAICAGNSPVTGEFPTQRPMTRSFDVYFDLRPKERLSKQWWGWWFETLSRSLWRHRNVCCAKGIAQGANATLVFNAQSPVIAFLWTFVTWCDDGFMLWLHDDVITWDVCRITDPLWGESIGHRWNEGSAFILWNVNKTLIYAIYNGGHFAHAHMKRQLWRARLRARCLQFLPVLLWFPRNYSNNVLLSSYHVCCYGSWKWSAPFIMMPFLACTVLSWLSHLPLVPHICVGKSRQHWFR